MIRYGWRCLRAALQTPILMHRTLTVAPTGTIISILTAANDLAVWRGCTQGGHGRRRRHGWWHGRHLRDVHGRWWRQGWQATRAQERGCPAQADRQPRGSLQRHHQVSRPCQPVAIACSCCPSQSHLLINNWPLATGRLRSAYPIVRTRLGVSATYGYLKEPYLLVAHVHQAASTGQAHAGADQARTTTIQSLVQSSPDLHHASVCHRRKLSLSRNLPCSTCSGKGTKSGRQYECTTCRGTGVQVQLRPIGPGMVQQIQSRCSTCSGNGTSTPARKLQPRC